MPEADTREDKNFHADIPAPDQGFFLKGSGAYDWGMKNRLARIFRPESGRTVMLAIDHGYFQGPTTGLERVDLNIVPIAQYADALMLTRGILRSTIPATHRGGIVLRASGGPSILKELSNERIALDMEDAVRMGAHAVAVQVFVGGEHETQSVENMTKLVDAGYRYGCPVPVVMAGGKKLPELEALEIAYRAVQEGAAGVDMGRNIFQSDSPPAMIQAVAKVVHEEARPEEAYELFQELSGAAVHA